MEGKAIATLTIHANSVVPLHVLSGVTDEKPSSSGSSLCNRCKNEYETREVKVAWEEWCYAGIVLMGQGQVKLYMPVSSPTAANSVCQRSPSNDFYSVQHIPRVNSQIYFALSGGQNGRGRAQVHPNNSTIFGQFRKHSTTKLLHGANMVFGIRSVPVACGVVY
jgi:hypothetical protein